MTEIILSVIAEGVLKKIGSQSLSDISLATGVKTELEKLGKTLSTIKAILLDAEEQQAKNHEVRDWLQKLKDVVYDMDDVLDEFSTEELRRKVEIQGSMLKEVSNFFSHTNPLAFHFKIGHKIKTIRERLDDIALDRIKFHFTGQVGNTRVENGVREQTHSFVPASNVIGRKDDEVKLVKLLLSFRNREDLPVVPIVGLGGLGKTTLAKLAYNDEKVIQSFELRMWICVSEDFRLNKVIEKIIKSATSGANYDGLDMDQLQTCLRDILNAKKFLLVLDDVWNDDPKRWTELRNLLIGGANGSTIVVTTRSKKIASIMGTIPLYKLSKLPYDDCLSLFMRCAFKEGHAKENSELVEVGKEIVHKCGGVPLAVKTLGSLLCMKTDVHEWLYIRDNDIWKLEQKENDILPALRLSYDQLPSYLKQCFAYCSIFPKDYVIGREELIYLWLAQGFIQSPNGSQQLEDIGNQYCNELLSRSLIQEEIIKFDNDIWSYKMHDLVHDLARQVIGKEWLDVDCNSKIDSESIRHVSFTEYDFFEKEFPTSLRAKKLRSFRFAYKVGPVSKSFIDTLILRFKCLRVLALTDSEFEELPSFVGKLKHLRYLSLSGNRSLKALPNSICKLLNLQTLYLSNCEQLQDLPRDIGKLISLRHLYLTSQLICLPEKGLQGLTSLRVLRLHRCNHLTSLSDGIQHLTSFQRLSISECPSLASLPSGMKHLTALEKLEIWNCQELNLLEGEDMQGLRSLRSLSIIGLPKLVAMPQGLQQSATTLQNLNIRRCPGLTTLPEWLQTLASLKILYIWDCPNLLSLPEGMQLLTALQHLVIVGCPHLSRRCKKEMGEDWPKISHIPKIDNILDVDSNDEDLGQ